MVFVYHLDKEVVSDRIDLMTYIIPPGKAYRIADDYHAEKLLEHKHYHGLVRVTEKHNEDTGEFKLDLDDAKKRSMAALEEADQKFVEQYVRTQQEDRLRRNFPAMPPEGRVRDILIRRKIDLGKKYNIYPVGWGKSEHESEVEKLKEDNAKLLERMKQMEAVLESITK